MQSARLGYILKPAQLENVTVEEIRSNATECHVQNRLVWGPTTDDGDTPITSYIVEYKHTVFNMILISKTVSGRTEHVICKLQASGYPREVHVDARASKAVTVFDLLQFQYHFSVSLFV